jgi:hypothetical protein
MPVQTTGPVRWPENGSIFGVSEKTVELMTRRAGARRF